MILNDGTRFPKLGIEEVLMKFKLHDIRKSKAWQELRKEGREQGQQEGGAQRLKNVVETLMAKGKTIAEVSRLFDIPVNDIRRLTKHLQ
jgi:predicted transposase YdaD